MDEGGLDRVFEKVDGSVDEMIDFLSAFISIPALCPTAEGEGEHEKAAHLEGFLKGLGFDVGHYDAPDDRVPSGKRPNLAAWLKGESDERRCIVMTHTDIVSPGDMDKWDSDPYQAVMRDGKLIGRGVEDNGQSLTSSIFAAKALMELGIKPRYDVGLLFVADEETGSNYGMTYLLDKGIFREGDMIIVPDGGDLEGRLLEVSEKSISWVKVHVLGGQCHASMPDLGNNALRAGMVYGVRVDKALHERFDAKDDIFDRPPSTFEPTKKDANVPNINTVPGEDTFYFDCRVLPQYELDDVMAEMRRVADEVEKEFGVRIELSHVQKEVAAPPTPADAPVVLRLMKAVEKVYHNDPFPGGIGGGTCAAILRRAGYNAVVWQKIEDTAHAPNEYITIENLVNDCKVFAHFYLDPS